MHRKTDEAAPIWKDRICGSELKIPEICAMHHIVESLSGIKNSEDCAMQHIVGSLFIIHARKLWTLKRMASMTFQHSFW